MKILWASNAPWGKTGYGTQTNQVVRRLVKDGHDVAVAANYGLMGSVMVDEDTGATVFPQGADAYSNDVMLGHYRRWVGDEPGWIITLFDVWVYSNPDFDAANIASWTPVDHAPVPPKVAAWARKHPTIAMSKFGQQVLADQGIDAMYAPHALDLNEWKPTPTLPDGQAVREAYNIPADAFLVMINAANKGNVPPRKAWGEMLQALAFFMDKHADVYAYIHTEMRGVYGGVDLIVLQSALGMDAGRIRVPDQYATVSGFIPNEAIAAHYTAADVLLSTSMGEGFGLAVIEAQACGTPVIVTNFSAQPELVGGGWTVPFQPWWDFQQAAWLALPHVEGIYKALEESYANRDNAEYRTSALAKAAEYDADKVYAEHWRPILKRLEAELNPPTRQQRRAARRKAA